MKLLRLFALLLLAIKNGQSDIVCVLKTGVGSAYNKVGPAALKGIYFHNNRNSQNMDLMECHCNDDDVSK